MLKVLPPSPPVPAVSTRSSRCGRTGRTCSRIASAQPAISSAVSPFRRSATRKPPSCAGVASPRMISSIAARASARERSWPSSRRARALLDHRSLQEVAGELGAERRQHRLGVELDAVDGQLAVTDGHHLAVLAGGGDLELVGDPRGGERVVAAGEEVLGQVRGRGPRPSWRITLALPWTSLRAGPISPPKASTSAWWPRQTPRVGTRGASRRTISSVAPDSSGRPGPGETTRCDRPQALGLVGVDRVVSPHLHLGPELAEQVREVVGERVVVVDEQDHGRASARSSARSSAASLARHSSCSALGRESATIPAPAWSSASPSWSTIVRIAMQVSSVPSGSA